MEQVKQLSNDDSEVLTVGVSGLAKMLGMSKIWIYQQRSKGLLPIPSIRYGKGRKGVRYFKKDVLEYMEASKESRALQQ